MNKDDDTKQVSTTLSILKRKHIFVIYGQKPPIFICFENQYLTNKKSRQIAMVQNWNYKQIINRYIFTSFEFGRKIRFLIKVSCKVVFITNFEKIGKEKSSV